MMGLGLGAETSALYFLLSRYFGRVNLGTITGAATGVMLGSGALATILLNAAYDAHANYRLGVFCILPVLAWNAVAMLLLGRYPFNAETDARSPAA
jgi:MFS family permease